MRESNYEIMRRLSCQHDLKTFVNMCDKALARMQITVEQYDRLVEMKEREEKRKKAWKF